MDRGNEPVVGTCDGTGAKIYVVLGFKPSRVDLVNIDSANLERVHWTSEMALVASSAHEGLKTKTSASADVTSKLAVSSTTQQGIRPYAGGDTLKYSKSSAEWQYGASSSAATEVFVDGHHSRASISAAAYLCYGSRAEPNPSNGQKVMTPEGFSIGADSDVNANGEQLQWTAWR